MIKTVVYGTIPHQQNATADTIAATEALFHHFLVSQSILGGAGQEPVTGSLDHESPPTTQTEAVLSDAGFSGNSPDNQHLADMVGVFRSPKHRCDT